MSQPRSPFWWVVSHGTDRCWVCYRVHGESGVAAVVEQLTEAKKTAPTLGWFVVNKSDLSPEQFRFVERMTATNPEHYRVKDGALEVRPKAWIEVSASEPHCGETVKATVHYSAEAPSEKVLSINGKTFTADADGEVSFTSHREGAWTLLPLSSPHLCLTTEVTFHKKEKKK